MCPSKDSTSWLDHIVSTEKLARLITNVTAEYEAALFDHFPICFNIDVAICNIFNNKNDNIVSDFVKWHKMEERDKLSIKANIDSEIIKKKILLCDVFTCFDLNCNNSRHKENLNDALITIKNVLIQSTENFKFVKRKKFKVIPGWNDHVKDFYNEARKDFHKWRENGKPANGILKENMRNSRAKFKCALNKCKQNETDIRNEKLLDNFKDKDYNAFWKEVHKTGQHNTLYPLEIDEVKDDLGISNLFSDRFRSVLNKNSDKQSGKHKKLRLTEKQKLEVLIRFSKEDIRRAIKSLKDGIGFDQIHSNHLKFESEMLIELLSSLFTSFIVHSYIPIDMLRGIITPIIKDKLGDLSKSVNYRPVMSSSVVLKLFEYCLLNLIEPLINLNDRQHGFRKRYSTSTACVALRETILYYTESNSNVYTSFIDISKAFDSVNHEKLIKKLSRKGIPDYVTRLIEYWYQNQFVKVKYKSCYSAEWRISNGVRQGGILSGLFFNIYIDSLLEKISSLNVGCSLGIIRSNVIAYADDLVLIAPSKNALQILVNEALSEANKLDLDFNQDQVIRKLKQI